MVIFKTLRRGDEAGQERMPGILRLQNTLAALPITCTKGRNKGYMAHTQMFGIMKKIHNYE